MTNRKLDVRRRAHLQIQIWEPSVNVWWLSQLPVKCPRRLSRGEEEWAIDFMVFRGK